MIDLEDMHFPVMDSVHPEEVDSGIQENELDIPDGAKIENSSKGIEKDPTTSQDKTIEPESMSNPGFEQPQPESIPSPPSTVSSPLSPPELPSPPQQPTPPVQPFPMVVGSDQQQIQQQQLLQQQLLQLQMQVLQQQQMMLAAGIH